MNDDYLWDKTGRDPDIERLERILRPLAHQTPRRRWLAPLSMAAAVALFVLLLAYEPDPGSRIVTSDQARTLSIADIGTVVADPYTELRILQTYRLRLERGTIHASIGLNARPRLFQVETPATTCVDLGCKYTLSVDASGRSIVRVLTGRVAFVDGSREVYVPAGAWCRAAPGRGSGTPLWDDAPPALVDAVAAFDAAADRRSAARRVVEQAVRAKDTLTLWHFLQDPEVAEIGLDALIRLAGPAPGIPRDVTLRRDSYALAAWKEHLEDFWR